jgi:hypothetical protein
MTAAFLSFPRRFFFFGSNLVCLLDYSISSYTGQLLGLAFKVFYSLLKHRLSGSQFDWLSRWYAPASAAVLDTVKLLQLMLKSSHSAFAFKTLISLFDIVTPGNQVFYSAICFLAVRFLLNEAPVAAVVKMYSSSCCIAVFYLPAPVFLPDVSSSACFSLTSFPPVPERFLPALILFQSAFAQVSSSISRMVFQAVSLVLLSRVFRGFFFQPVVYIQSEISRELLTFAGCWRVNRRHSLS